MHNDRGLLQLIIVAKLPKLDRQAGDIVAYDPANQTRLNSEAGVVSVPHRCGNVIAPTNYCTMQVLSNI